jgi:Protein of unknown function (DUF1353)
MARCVGVEVNNFLTELRTEYIDGRGWKILEPFTYRLGHENGSEFVTVGAGFVTDFASIPRLLKLRWPSPGGPWDKPAVIHDCLYQQRKVFNGINGTYRLIERAEADAIFHEAMKVTGTRGDDRWCIYRGVRLGGWKPWGKYRTSDRESR